MGDIGGLFSIQAFLIIFRETLESAVIISVLLSLVHQSFETRSAKRFSEQNKAFYQSIEAGFGSNEMLLLEQELASEKRKRILLKQIWIGGISGLICCFIIGGIIVSVFYSIGDNLWTGAEHYWEGAFSIIASLIISFMGLKILRITALQEKWRKKFSPLIIDANVFDKRSRSDVTREGFFRRTQYYFSEWCENYFLFLLPFITTLREGMEAIVFLGGIGIDENSTFSSLINSLFAAVILATVIGLIMYRSGNLMSIQTFLIISTCFLYLIAAGLFSKGIWHFELQHFINLCDGFDVSETGHGPGSYDITKSVWHINCCNGELQDDGAFWMIMTATLGWTNSATHGSVIGYNFYWLIIIISLWNALKYEKSKKLNSKTERSKVQKSLIYRARSNMNFPIPELRMSSESFDSVSPLKP